MAMTLRLTEDEDRMLAELADAQGMSKQQAARAAIVAQAQRVTRRSRVLQAADRISTRDAELLDRLSQ